MSGRSSTIRVSVVSDTKAIRRGVDQVNTKLGKLGRAAKSAAGLAAGVFAASAIKDQVGKVVSAASDAQQSLGATGHGVRPVRRHGGTDLEAGR